MLQEIVPLELGEKWINDLWKRLVGYKRNREIELNAINDSILFGDPLELAKVYVEPYCQEINPADRHDEDFFAAKEPLFKKVSEFLQLKSFHQGNNQLFVLSDAGMGKTSFLVMLKLLHITSLWPKGYSCVLDKLRESSIEQIQSIENKRKTVLLLDSLDEDPTAHGRVKERLLEILNITRNFSKVIITCRTQFFPETESDPFEVPGRIRIGPFVCPSKYLSLFDDAQVDHYLRKRFPRKLFSKAAKLKIEKAKTVVHRMRSLRCRPMLLSFIEDLIASDQTLSFNSEYSLYLSLVKSWLMREETKTGIESALLLNVCASLAYEMQSRKAVRISAQELAALIRHSEDIGRIQCIDITGRSLLNRNSNGDYRFAHYSIQEFLVVYYILNLATLDTNQSIYPTDFIKKLLEGNTDMVRVRFKQMTINCDEDIESGKLTGVGDSKYQFLSKAKVIDLITEFNDELADMDIEAFGRDLDIPAYLRKIIARHSRQKILNDMQE